MKMQFKIHMGVPGGRGFLWRLFEFFAIQFASYIRYLLLSPVVIFIAGGAMLVLVGFQDIFFSPSGALSPTLTPSFSFDEADILKWYGIASLFFYAIGTIIEKFSNRERPRWRLKKKLFVVILVLFCEYAAFTILVPWLRLAEGTTAGEMYAVTGIIFGFAAAIALFGMTMAHAISKWLVLFQREDLLS